jgi:hypothetical protein
MLTNSLHKTHFLLPTANFQDYVLLYVASTIRISATLVMSILSKVATLVISILSKVINWTIAYLFEYHVQWHTGHARWVLVTLDTSCMVLGTLYDSIL